MDNALRGVSARATGWGLLVGVLAHSMTILAITAIAYALILGLDRSKPN